MRNSVSAILSTILSGLSSVLIQLLAASVLGAEEYARFAMGAATIIFVAGLSHAIVGQTDLIRGNRPFDPTAAGAATMLAVVTAGIGLGIMMLARWVPGDSAAIVGLAVSIAAFFILQSSADFRAFRVARAQWALVSDVTVLSLALGAILAYGNEISQADTMIWYWGFAVGAGFLVVVRPLQFWGGIRDARMWWHKNNDLIVPGSLEYLLQSTVPYLLYWVILGLGGASALAGYRIVQLLFGGLGNLAQGLNAIEMPLLSDNPTRHKIRSLLFRNALIIALPAVLLTVAIAKLPDGVGDRLFGQSWFGVGPFLAAGAIHGLVNALLIPNYQVLRILGEAKYSLKVRTATVVLIPVLSLIMGATYGAVGIAWALALVTLLGYGARLLRVLNRTSPNA